ncbi:MAG: SpoIID/LytB domain-containing protein [Paludibacteraceae bacterium]|nr:SpoIID/LytB domain-containing protein [Paludibacteraceae bacterium]
MKQQEPEIHVGVMQADEVTFCLHGCYDAPDGPVSGPAVCVLQQGLILWNGRLHARLTFTPRSHTDFFSLSSVSIGKGFHWQQTEEQQFFGTLILTVASGRIGVINRIGAEQYLQSVISSEMSAQSPSELLKAHAVISRSWLMHALGQRSVLPEPTGRTDAGRWIRWYERDAHRAYDVCADDHCQRYQGFGRLLPAAVSAVQETRGEVLTSGGQVCDARFSKCCGGVTERFQTCWADTSFDYLQPVRDADRQPLPDLTDEAQARRWITSSPRAFCNTQDRTFLSRVLNLYDQPTTDFYRWQVRYTAEQLTDLVNRRSGLDIGTVEDLAVMRRGASGRIEQLKIVGSHRTVVVGKELEIRRLLSETHLKSSAFVIDRAVDGSYVLTGAGWGHGVGLCQIGAAVMAAEGRDYRTVLAHYYPAAEIGRLW